MSIRCEGELGETLRILDKKKLGRVKYAAIMKYLVQNLRLRLKVVLPFPHFSHRIWIVFFEKIWLVS